MADARTRAEAVSRGGPTHQSIGEVLATLREEFPDITISKIRFLESQGLIDPERTPSGYRKFYAADVERLRWILRQQKEHFLPLKVIRGRLEELESSGDVGAVADLEANGNDDGTAVTLDLEPSPPVADPDTAPSRGRRPTRSDRRARSAGPDVSIEDDSSEEELAVSATGASLTRAELARAAGLDDAQLEELESYGLLSPSIQTRDRALFDEDALAVARLAAGFFRHGVEARHLRMYRQFAEREAILFEQVLLGVLRQRNPEARARAQSELEELARLGRGLRTAYLRRAVRDVLSE
ncbi:MAG TPA: MerR family transcriptional regulator [Acidimicrobiia bacterium]|jgi:DNA-binding transcriptional MerR regulator